jgi:hypothetical protein
MKPAEKKYRVASFTRIQKILSGKQAEKIQGIVSTHYYGLHDGNDVEKFVEYRDKLEVHVLKEQDGRFTLVEHKEIVNKESGFAWLKSRGFTTVNIVKMDYVEFEYNHGIVGLYVIDDFLYSVILCYLPTDLDTMQKEFGLETAEVISLPYNKYLSKINRLRSMQLN